MMTARMRIRLRDIHGKELDSAIVIGGENAPAEAMLLLARRERLDPGDLLIVEEEEEERRRPRP
jgi:hypothetical protein